MRRVIALLLALMLGTTGCLSAGDVADYAFVLSFGIERGDTFAYRIVLLVAMPKAGGEDGATLDTGVYSAEARTLYEAIETLNSGMPLRLRFSRVSLILLSEPLLREGRIGELLDFSLGALDIHSNVRMMAAHGDLKEIYEALQSDADPSFSKSMQNIDALDTHAGTVIDARCRAVWEALGAAPFDLVLPCIGVGELDLLPDAVGGEAYPKRGGALVQSSANAASVIGSAVFDGAYLVGTLSGYHTQLVGMVRGDFAEGQMTLYHPAHGTVSVKLRLCRASVSLEAVALSLEATVLYPLAAGEDEALVPWLASETERGLAETFAALQALNADAMGFGRFDAMQHPFAVTEDWKARYPAISPSFAVEVRLLRSGGAA